MSYPALVANAARRKFLFAFDQRHAYRSPALGETPAHGSAPPRPITRSRTAARHSGYQRRARGRSERPASVAVHADG
jgi:hypothetical protein